MEDPEEVFATTSMHPSAGKIAIHEIGHSFANLRDEYYAGDYYAREGINMTKETDPEQVIWKNWYGDAGVGIYQHCCGGQSSDWYRPHQNCRMRSISKNFCGVCSEAIIDKIYSITHPILDSLPVQNIVPVVSNNGILFGGEFIYPTPDSFEIEWILNDEIILGKENAFEYFEKADFPLVENTLVLKITDTTDLSRSYWPYAGYDYEITWNVIVESCPENLELSMEHVGNETHIANQTIISDSQVLEESTMYQAGISITLDKAFEVKNGAVFQVVIGGCN